MDIDKTKRLQDMMAGQSTKANVIAITSGKGGVGKSNIAANLAICLAASNKKVLLLDADLGLGNVDVLMNINSKYNLSHVISGQKSVAEVTQLGPAGVEVVCGASGLEDMANISSFQRNRLIEELDEMQNNADVILIDTAAGIDKSVVSFCRASDHVLVVTTPEPTAMTDAYAMIKLLAMKDYPGRISMVVNMAQNVSEGKKIYRQISDVARRFIGVQVYDAGVICSSDKLTMSVRLREPVVLAYPKSNVTATLVAMAARLSRGATVRRAKEGFFQRVVNLLF